MGCVCVGDGAPDPAVTALLLAAGRTASSFPADFAAAIASGKVRSCCSTAIHLAVMCVWCNRLLQANDVHCRGVQMACANLFACNGIHLTTNDRKAV